jgi:hypothetical protein
MEQSGEQCTVVFTLIDTEPASKLMQRLQCIALQIPPRLNLSERHKLLTIYIYI